MEKKYKTRDMNLASSLVACGFKVEVRKNNNNICDFLFKNSKNLDTTIAQYWNQELEIEASNLFTAIKNIKARIYD
ncbi:hypothetical protein KKC88_00165 [Patescibacteria group bacterium]|nr:hypothetical protein [Patescibacteria group bacterium]MBU1673045.1 hypothetical protein [Patescibacteria group bacterium]